MPVVKINETAVAPVRLEPVIRTDVPLVHEPLPSVTEVTVGGVEPKVHELTTIVVPQVVVADDTAVVTGLHDAMPVVLSKSPKVTITCNNGVAAHALALNVLTHTEMVTVRDCVAPVVHAVEHQASTDWALSERSEGLGDVVQHGAGGDAFNVGAMKL